MLENMLNSGFDKDVSIGLINSAINLNSNEESSDDVKNLLEEMENLTSSVKEY